MNQTKAKVFLEQQITNSGVFKLDEKSKPIGIVNLTPKKFLSMRENAYLPFQTHILRNMIVDMSDEITCYANGPKDYKTLEKLIDNFENELSSFFKNWDFSPNDLNPHYDRVLGSGHDK